MTVTKAELLNYLRAHRHAVQCSISADLKPQSAIVGIAVSDELEIIFDTLASSRKSVNLRTYPAISFVIGSTASDAQRSVQFEGIADEPTGAEQEAFVNLYLSVFPDGRDRQSWPGLTYFRVKPRWIRYSDYSQDPPVIAEFADSGSGLAQRNAAP